MFDQPGILGTGASLKSDLSLLAYILLIVPAMLVGFVFARRKMFIPHHKLTMTAIMMVNWVIISLLMSVSYREGVVPYLNDALGDPRVALPTIHLVTGGVAQILGTYLVLRMWLEHVLPQWIMVRNIKRYMRFTLALWLVTSALGILIYITWYARPEQVSAAPAPVSTPEVVVTSELEPLSTEPVSPVVTQEFIVTAETSPLATPEIQPETTASLNPVTTPEVRPASTEAVNPVQTAEVDDDDDSETEDEDDDSDSNSDDDDDSSNSGMGMGN
jgi:uncharacterized membrane protein YozB (DUF420 family)